jgi:peroxiredoxin
MVRSASLAVVGLALLAGTAAAGKYNKVVNIGDAAPAFAGLEGADGQSHSLADLKDKDVLVLCVTCNHCPVAVAYEPRMVAFAKKHAGPDSKVAFLAVSVSNSEIDQLPKMKERVKAEGLNYAYAHDPSQKFGKDLGASKTPEFYVYDKNRKLIYTGAFDDNMNPDKATKHYVEDAVKAALHGETPAVTETAAVGCGIGYEKKK